MLWKSICQLHSCNIALHRALVARSIRVLQRAVECHDNTCLQFWDPCRPRPPLRVFPGTRISALLPAAQQCFCFAYLCRCCFGMAVPKHLAAGVGTWSQVCSCRQGTPVSPPSPHEGAPNSIAYAFLPSRVSLVWLIFNPSTCWDNSTWGNQENLVPSC